MKFLLKQCLNDTELLAFNKIEDIALRIYTVICDLDQDKMKRNDELIWDCENVLSLQKKSSVIEIQPLKLSASCRQMEINSLSET